MLKKIQFILLLACILQINAQTSCGPNCPGGNCPTCPCGVLSVRQDASAYCQKSSWNQNCCKCIILRRSKQNQKYTQFNSPRYYLGQLPVQDLDATNFCGRGVPQMCLQLINQQCAFKLFTKYGNWDYWYYDAVACGCPVSKSFEIAQKRIQVQRAAYNNLLSQ